MFQSVIIGPDGELCARLQAALEATGQVEVTRTFDHYPTAIDLVRALRAQAAELLTSTRLRLGLDPARLVERVRCLEERLSD